MNRLLIIRDDGRKSCLLKRKHYGRVFRIIVSLWEKGDLGFAYANYDYNAYFPELKLMVIVYKKDDASMDDFVNNQLETAKREDCERQRYPG